MIRLYNTRTRIVEDFVPLNPPIVTVYCCGPTVYDWAHIGNFRTYTMTDILVRTLRYFDYKVKYVMNITDVGHLTSDDDHGEDKMEKGAKREGKSAWDVARFFTEAFLADSKKLYLMEPDVRPKPTDHIAQQITMIQTLFDKGFAYQIDDGIYFDTSTCITYGELIDQNRDDLREGARIEPNPQKRNPTDFALWKFSPHGPKRDMEWESPWGRGFPGWHIECSAMSMKYLGPSIDIHTGGTDLIPIHHTNEIAQSEAASGISPFVRFWVHGQFVLVDGEKMAKSKGNFYRLFDIEEKSFDPIALRYLYLSAHYRSFLNFTWEALANAQRSLDALRLQISNFKFQISNSKRNTLSPEKLTSIEAYREAFEQALENDLNMPQALAIVWEVVKSNIPSSDKYDLLLNFDEVLGFDLQGVMQAELKEIPEDINHLLVQREAYRKAGNFTQSDSVRKEIEEKGFTLEDTSEGPRVKKK